MFDPSPPGIGVDGPVTLSSGGAVKRLAFAISPKKGQETGPTIPRSVRFAAPVWKLLEQRAKEDGVSLHAALRAAVVAWVARSLRTTSGSSRR